MYFNLQILKRRIKWLNSIPICNKSTNADARMPKNLFYINKCNPKKRNDDISKLILLNFIKVKIMDVKSMISW